MSRINTQNNKQANIWLKLVAVLFAFIALASAQADEKLESQRQAFKEAVKLAEQAKPESLSYQKNLLKDYVLKSDIQAIYLRNSVKRQPNKNIQEFLAKYPNQATTNDLYRKWLDYLYTTRQWKTYIEFAPDPKSTKLSVERRCKYLEARIRTVQKVDFVQEALPLWMVGKSQPDECDALFGILKNNKLFTKERINNRIDLALERARFKLASYLATQLGEKDRKAVVQKIALWRKMSASPESQLKQALKWKDGKTSQAISAYGLRKLARRDIDKALKIWPKLNERFKYSVAEKNALENYIALRSAYKRHPQTLKVYAAANTESMSLREVEWQVRNALWNQNWSSVLSSIQAMPSSSQTTSQWRYWQARAYDQLGEKQKANDIYTELANGTGYFEFLAADQLKTDYQFKHNGLIVNDQIQAQLKQRVDLRRARELAAVNMQGRSRSEWRSALNSMSSEEKAQAGYLANSWGLATSSIQTAVNSSAREDVDILYPRAYENSVQAMAKRYSIEPAWIYGVIRQESLFMSDVRSSANAYGLMQLLPATAKQTARKNKIKHRGYSDLITPSRNIELGSAYLSEIQKRLQANPVLATAGYNGGPHRVRTWLPEQNLPADIWVENIVFNETRNYVQKVLNNKIIYSWRLHGKAPRLSSFMHTVKPREK